VYGCANRLAVLPCALCSLPATDPTPHLVMRSGQVVELAHLVLHAVREHGHLECPALQYVHNMARKSRVCRERIVNAWEVKMVR
jgi:hypothetical protein